MSCSCPIFNLQYFKPSTYIEGIGTTDSQSIYLIKLQPYIVIHMANGTWKGHPTLMTRELDSRGYWIDSHYNNGKGKHPHAELCFEDVIIYYILWNSKVCFRIFLQLWKARMYFDCCCRLSSSENGKVKNDKKDEENLFVRQSKPDVPATRHDL
jgi:hypothetical protein